MARVLTCIPPQLATEDDKLGWLLSTAESHTPDLFVTPQEFFGGVMAGEGNPRTYTREGLMPKLGHICRTSSCSMAAGVVEHCADGLNREAIWFVDRAGKLVGSIYKFALPSYDHVLSRGEGNIVPETDIARRFQTFELEGFHIGGIFCWEAFSDVLWTGLRLAGANLVLNMIKFGVSAWPTVRKKNGRSCVEGFGYAGWGDGTDPWIERLHIGSTWQVKCPVVCSTNSWGLRPVSRPLAGCVWELEPDKQSIWYPTKEMGLKQVPEKVIVDQLDPMAIEAVVKSKFHYKEVTGEWPPYSLGQYTMALKMHRIENRIRLGTEDSRLQKSGTVQKKGFGL